MNGLSISDGELNQIAKELYLSEINFAIETDWDGGFWIKLGDDLNGFTWEGNYDIRDFDLLCMLKELAKEAAKQYPNSKFSEYFNQREELSGTLSE
jgi:hypothetical protein